MSIARVLDGTARWCVVESAWESALRDLPRGVVHAVVTDPPYGMKLNTDSTRFRGGARRAHDGRGDYGPIVGDDRQFDPSPWLGFPKVILFGANHFAQRLPRGTTLVWIKKRQHLWGTFLSDAEIAWQKGGHGVYCCEVSFPPPVRIKEGGARKSVHPTQKPIELMRWCLRRLKLAPDSVVLDPFAGSGTTGVACMLEGHRFVGIEREAAHCDVARRRIEAAAREAAR